MKKSAFVILALGPILAAGCMNSKPATPTAQAPATQPVAVAQPTQVDKSTPAPVVPATAPAKSEVVTTVTPLTQAQPPTPVTPPPPPAVTPAAPAMSPAEVAAIFDGRPTYMKLLGEGVQIYECKKAGAGYAWELKAPEALLYNDKGRAVGKHYAGPTWEYSDGSKLVGQKIGSEPHAGAVPLLEIKVVSTSGKGKLAVVKYIKRVETVGGTTPTLPADAAHAGKEERVPYRATYVFYTGS